MYKNHKGSWKSLSIFKSGQRGGVGVFLSWHGRPGDGHFPAHPPRVLLSLIQRSLCTVIGYNVYQNVYLYPKNIGIAMFTGRWKNLLSSIAYWRVCKSGNSMHFWHCLSVYYEHMSVRERQCRLWIFHHTPNATPYTANMSITHSHDTHRTTHSARTYYQVYIS